MEENMWYTTNTLFRDFDIFFDYGRTTPNETLEFKKTDSGLKLRMELPGFSENDINIQFENKHLIVSGKVEDKYFKKDLDFKKSFFIGGDYDVENTNARMKDGVLYIELPFIERAKPKKIEVRKFSA